MSRIFKALERAEAEGRRPSAGDLRPPSGGELRPPADPLGDLDLPEPQDEYERLRVALALATRGTEQKSVMFVGVLPGEGVSTLSLGFACATLEAASQGVLVVDANTARPDLAERLGVAPRVGLAELLTKEASRDDAIVKTAIQRLLFLGPGRRPVDLSQSRVRDITEELLADFRAAFDCVVIDGGALRTSSESLLLAGRVDAVVLVIRAERTGADAARAAAAQLRRAGANLAGTFLTRRREYLPGFLARRL